MFAEPIKTLEIRFAFSSSLFVSVSNKNRSKVVHTFAECLRNQSKLEKLGSRSVRLFSFQVQMKTALKLHVRSPSVCGTNQNSRNSVRIQFVSFRIRFKWISLKICTCVRRVFAEPIKTWKTRFAFNSSVFVSSSNENRSKSARALAKCSPNQSKLEKLGSRSVRLFSF